MREQVRFDLRFYVEPEHLLELWDELVLPPAVRRAWTAHSTRLRDV